MADDNQQRPPLFTLDKATLVPIGLLVSVVLASIGATTWIQGTLLDLKHQIDLLGSRLESMAIRDSDAWRLHDQAAWIELLSARNPSLNIPPIQPRSK